MAFYRKFILPHLINAAMKNKESARQRPQVVSLARGEVVEVGVGSGLNLPLYSKEVRSLRAVDPSPELLQMASKRAASAVVPVELLNASAEALPFESASADAIVMTWTLCSIPDPGKALAEMFRVLRPGGELLFVEHGAAPDAGVKAWQDRINSPWHVFTGGCNLNRQIDRLIASTGFEMVQLDKSYMRGLRIFSFTYRGRARKR